MKGIVFFYLCFTQMLLAQNWQQKVDYKMQIDMDVKTYQYKGLQKITYANNSPETLTKVYYHLYNNAFQPGSAMDVKIQNTLDADQRVVVNVGTKEEPIRKSRIALLKPSEIGFIKIKSLTQKGKKLTYVVEGTVLEVQLETPLKPGKKTQLEMEFLGQVPKQIRRSGRNNKEGVTLSMTQWYPKLAAYDHEGWHANPYLGAEFYADWGDYDVSIKIQKDYVLGGTGYLQNAQSVGHGYQNPNKPLKVKIEDDQITWRFKARNIHDFSWAADKEYIHFIHQVQNGPKVHFLHKKDLEAEKQAYWQKLPKVMDELFAFYNSNIGEYPYQQYSVIQGGDGGMEYAMCTLITARRSYESLVGVVAHELAHSWFQFLLASNETKYAWLDEGFTTYMSTIIESKILNQPLQSEFTRMYLSYLNLVENKIEQPLTTHGDAFDYNYGYGVSSYNKGAMFLSHLKYIVGEKAFEKSMKQYFKKFSFKHPSPKDFLRIVEIQSHIELDWFYNYYVETIKSIDYDIFKVEDQKVVLLRKGDFPMPLEVKVEYEDGTLAYFYIPLDVMRGQRKDKKDFTVLKDWAAAKPSYEFLVSKTIKQIHLDFEERMMDVDRSNNIYNK